MYESPIEVVFSDLVSDSVKKTDEYIVACVQQVGVKVDKDELVKALEFDREQYEKGWNDRDNEIVRCKDCSWCATVKSFGKEYLYCDAFYDHADGDLIGVSLMVEPDHSCSWGERREDGEI